MNTTPIQGTPNDCLGDGHSLSAEVHLSATRDSNTKKIVSFALLLDEPAEAAELTTIPTPPNQFTATLFSDESLANPFIAVIFSEEEWAMVVRTVGEFEFIRGLVVDASDCPGMMEQTLNRLWPLLTSFAQTATPLDPHALAEKLEVDEQIFRGLKDGLARLDGGQTLEGEFSVVEGES